MPGGPTYEEAVRDGDYSRDRKGKARGGVMKIKQEIN